MAKYYVTSGNQTFVVTAMDAEGAALWAIHCWENSTSRLNLEGSTAETPSCRNRKPDACEEMSISEIGYGRCDAGRFSRSAAEQKYHQLNAAITCLLAKLDA